MSVIILPLQESPGVVSRATCGGDLSYSDRLRVVFAAVKSLFFRGSPSAILGRIGAVYVHAINCGAFWAFAHIGKKVWERFPAVADIYAAPTVQRETVVCGVVASPTHMNPSVIGRGRLGSGSHGSMFESALAAAGLGAPSLEAVRVYRLHGSAFALAQPQNLVSPAGSRPGRFPDDGKKSEFLADQIVFSAHMTLL